MTVYFHNSENIIEYEDAVKQYNSGSIPPFLKATALDPRNGEIIFSGNIKNLINRIENEKTS